jgi:MSHA biogenesis protein MshQ
VSAFFLWLLLSHLALPLAAQPWWDGQFGYRQQVLVETGSNTPHNGYIGYTVRLENLDTASLVAAGRLSANCDDLRVAYWDGSNWTQLDRHLIDCNTAATDLRFMLQAEIADNSSDGGYYLYYGSASAGSPNPLATDNVYLWYDDASSNRLSSYIQGRGDDWHGTGWRDSFSWNGAGYYTYDTGDNYTDSLRRAVAERDLYIEADFYHFTAYDFDMTSGLTVRYLSSGGSGASESSSHYYVTNRADSPFQISTGYTHDLSIMKDNRGDIAIGPADGESAPAISGNQWRKQALAIWGINDTNGKFWDDDISANVGPMGWPTKTESKSGTDASDREGEGDAGLIVAQDGALVDNLLIRRYTEPEPTLTPMTVEIRLLSYHAMDEPSWAGAAGEVVDSGSDGYSGTAVNGPTTASSLPAIAGDPGTCGYGVFDGSDDYVSLAGYPDLNDNFTIAAWIYPFPATGSQNDWRIFADDQNNSRGFAFSLHDGGNRRLRFFSRGVNPVILDAPSNQRVNQNSWSFVAAVHDADSRSRSIYLNGQFVAQDTYSGTWGTDGGVATIGGEPAGREGVSRWRFNGYIDEMRVYEFALSETDLDSLMLETHACTTASTLDHIRILHDGEGLTCAPEEVTIQACENSSCDTLYTGAVTIDLSPSGWVGGDSVSFSGGATTVELRQTTVGTVSLGTSSSTPASSNATRCFIGASENCDMSFVDAGFIFDVPDQTSCETSAAVSIQAVRTSDTGDTCAPAFTGAKTINFWSGYADPASGTRSLDVNGTTVSGSAPGTGISLNFDASAQASFTVSYADAGRLQLNARYTGTGDESGLVLNGNDQFVVRPESLYSRATTDGSTLLDNGASSGSPSWTAGADFQLQLRAQCADGTLLPNYQPTNAELWTEMSSPAVDGGSLSLRGSSFPGVTTAGWNNISSLFSDGVVVEPAQSASDSASHALARFSEVGVLTLHLRDNSYMGGAINPAADLVVGRFRPAYFEVSGITPGQLSSRCNGVFSYTGTPMNYAVQPGMVITAHQQGGGVTTNYTGAFGKLSGSQGSITFTLPTRDALQLGADLANRTDLTALMQSNLINILDNGDGTLNYSLSPLDSYTYSRNANALIGPYSASVNLVLNSVVDGDGVSDDGTPVTITPTGSELRYGRLVVDDAYGPQTSNLLVPVRAEYYDGSGFIDNRDDYCSVIAPVAAAGLDNWQGSLTTGETSVSDTSVLLMAGSGEITLAAPGVGAGSDTNDGSVDLTLDLSLTIPPQSWLLNDENGDGSYGENPQGSASFGMYRGDDRFIYWRESP